MILFGLVWSLPQERVKGNCEDLKLKNERKKKKKNTEKGEKIVNVINLCLSETVFLLSAM